jgi:hypothetical protein
MIITRRNILRSLLAAPAIAAADRLMPVKLFEPSPTGLVTLDQFAAELATLTRKIIPAMDVGIYSQHPLLTLLYANANSGKNVPRVAKVRQLA